MSHVPPYLDSTVETAPIVELLTKYQLNLRVDAFPKIFNSVLRNNFTTIQSDFFQEAEGPLLYRISFPRACRYIYFASTKLKVEMSYHELALALSTLDAHFLLRHRLPEFQTC